MACVNPLYIKQDKSISKLGCYDQYKSFLKSIDVIRFDSFGNMFYRVPCGWCLNCRIDKRNWLEDSINHELKYVYNDVGSFVTLTYDNLHILNNVVTEYDIFENKKIKLDSNGKPLLTCHFKDGVDFIKRLRSYIKYHKLDCPLIRKDFKYVMCTEYGEEKNRCHIHLLLLGLDPKQTYKIISKCWSKGIIDNGRILQGGIRYILDYMDKLPHGKQLEEQFKDIGIEPPKMKHSKGIGRKLIFDNLDYILNNDLCYPCGAFNKNRPIPMYWKKVILKRNENFSKYFKNIQEKMNTYQIKKKNNKNYSFSEMNAFVAEQAFKQHKKQETKLRNQGKVPPYVIYKEYAQKINDKLIDEALYGDVVPF